MFYNKYRWFVHYAIRILYLIYIYIRENIYKMIDILKLQGKSSFRRRKMPMPPLMLSQNKNLVFINCRRFQEYIYYLNRRLPKLLKLPFTFMPMQKADLHVYLLLASYWLDLLAVAVINGKTSNSQRTINFAASEILRLDTVCTAAALITVSLTLIKFSL